MNCPKCNATSQESSICNYCGYDFTTNQSIEPVVRPVPGEPVYLYISTARLVLMSFFTVGLYEAYWIFKNWSYLKKREDLKIMPFWRGVFGIFFCHSLLKKIHEDSVLNSVETPNFSPSLLATLWVVFSVIANIANKITDNIQNTTIEYLVLAVSCLTILFFVPVQQYINIAHERLECKKYYTLWSAGHIVCIVFGILLWGLLIMSLLIA